MPTETERLREAAQRIKAGEIAVAKALVASVLKENNRNAQAWYLAAYTYDDENRKVRALEQALAIDPQHDKALRLLQRLRPQDELDLLMDIAAPKQKTNIQPLSHYQNAEPKSYVNASVVVLVLYFFFWLPGVIVNLIYLNEASEKEKESGQELPGVGGLRAMWLLFGFLPIALVVVYFFASLVF
jgi:ferric-dicitrate binding protein FerR (iron transport regulator)